MMGMELLFDFEFKGLGGRAQRFNSPEAVPRQTGVAFDLNHQKGRRHAVRYV
jgi:hypothetical protein